MTTTITVDEVKLMARWSHKHLAHLVNLGRFGIHPMIEIGWTPVLFSHLTSLSEE